MGDFAREKIGVAVRFRPLGSGEKEAGWVVGSGEGGSIWREEAGAAVEKIFAFDRVFNDASDNEMVYEDAVAPIVRSALEGYNGTVFAYGQTGSGKTHTIHGSADIPGVIAYAVRDVFAHIDTATNNEFLLGVSLFEIYKEHLTDLFDPEAKLQVRETKGEVYVAHLTEKLVRTEEDIVTHIDEGLKKRRVGKTNMNERSSRSHVIFRLSIVSKPKGLDKEGTVARLHFVDLAGSENSQTAGTSGERLAEGSSINLSLCHLITVIRQLSDRAKFISFRDSKLTRILQNSLDGSARVSLIATVSPADVHTSKSTLQFASSAKSIATKAEINKMKGEENLARRYEAKIAELQAALDVANKNDEAAALRKQLDNLNEFLIHSTHLPTDEDATLAFKKAKARRHTLCPSSIGMPREFSAPVSLQLRPPRAAVSLQPQQRPTSPDEEEAASSTNVSFVKANPEFLVAEWAERERVTPSPQPLRIAPEHVQGSPEEEADKEAEDEDSEIVIKQVVLDEEEDEETQMEKDSEPEEEKAAKEEKEPEVDKEAKVEKEPEEEKEVKEENKSEEETTPEEEIFELVEETDPKPAEETREAVAAGAVLDSMGLEASALEESMQPSGVAYSLARMGLEESALEDSILTAPTTTTAPDSSKKRLYAQTTTPSGSVASPGSVAIPRKRQSTARRSVVAFTTSLATLAESSEDSPPHRATASPAPKSPLASAGDQPDLSELRRRLAEAEAELATERERREEAESRLADQDESRARLTSFIDHERHVAALSESALNSPLAPSGERARLSQLEAEAESLRSSLAKAAKETENFKADADGYKMMMEECRAKATKAAGAEAAAKDQLDQVKEELDQALAQLRPLKEGLVLLQPLKEELAQTKASLESREEECNKLRRSQEEMKTKLEDETRKLQKQVETGSEECLSYKESKQNLEKELAEAKESQEKMSKEVAQLALLKEELAQVQASLESRENEFDKLRRSQDEMKTKMEDEKRELQKQMETGSKDCLAQKEAKEKLEKELVEAKESQAKMSEEMAQLTLLKDQLAQARTSLESREDECNKLRRSQEEMKTKLEDETRELQKQVETGSEECLSYKESKQQLEKELTEAKESQEKMSEEVAQLALLKEELAQVRASLESREEEFDKLRRSQDEMKTKLEDEKRELQKQMETESQDCLAQKEAKEKLEKELAEAKESHAKMSEEMAQLTLLKDQLTQARTTLESREEECDKLRRSQEEMKGKFEEEARELQKQVETGSEECLAHRQSKERLEEELTQAKESHQKRLLQLESEAAELRERLGVSQASTRALQKSLREMEEAEDARAEAEAAKPAEQSPPAEIAEVAELREQMAELKRKENEADARAYELSVQLRQSEEKAAARAKEQDVLLQHRQSKINGLSQRLREAEAAAAANGDFTGRLFQRPATAATLTAVAPPTAPTPAESAQNIPPPSLSIVDGNTLVQREQELHLLKRRMREYEGAEKAKPQPLTVAQEPATTATAANLSPAIASTPKAKKDLSASSSFMAKLTMSGRKEKKSKASANTAPSPSPHTAKSPNPEPFEDEATSKQNCKQQ